MRPRIGITSGLGGDHWLAGGSSWRAYAEAVERAGGEAAHLNPLTRGCEPAVLADLQGIVFSGGHDIDLSMYPRPPLFPGEDAETVMARYRMKPERDRDAYELPLLFEALQLDVPVLGICRGCQLLNVALGGYLILDIAAEVGTDPRHESTPPPESASSRHSLQILPGTLLASILEPERYQECNSRHHQAVRLDETFTARMAAVCPEDGIVEAIEVPERRWAAGVQWHPEHPRDEDIRRKYEPLFRAFVEAAS